MAARELECKEIRKRIFVTGYKGGMAHLASCFSCVEILYSLYLEKTMQFDPKDPLKADRDRLVLSKGHAGLALYTIMSMAGYMDKSVVDTYLQENALIGGEPCMRDLPGIEASTGSLGHGLSVACGMAMSQKLDGNGAKTFVILGDGECEEGVVWEGFMSAPAFGLDNLTAILDCNEIQKMDRVKNTIGYNNWNEKLTSFGWEVVEVDGHDIDALNEALGAENHTGKPRFVIAHTTKGKGVSIMENDPNWHFRLPKKKELKYFLTELGIDESEVM